MTRVLVVTGDRDTAFNMEDELQLIGDDIEVVTVCTAGEYSGDTLSGIDVVITDGTTRPHDMPRRCGTYDWFHRPEEEARVFHCPQIQVIKMPLLYGQSLPGDDITHYALEALNVIRRW